ncbi:MAG TPA: hypothetical protein VLI39_01480 [Sedimentisphaerales bacterium]|nr:hypothetical protein [Sedimentisphaerales bacterium]
MFEQYALSVAVALTILMLTALVVLAVVLASMDHRGLVYGVVVTMGMTSLATACLVGLLVLFLAYGPVARDPHHPGYVVVTIPEHVTARDEESIGAPTSPTEMEGIVPLPPGQSEQHPTCVPTPQDFDGLSAREVSGEGQ